MEKQRALKIDSLLCVTKYSFWDQTGLGLNPGSTTICVTLGKLFNGKNPKIHYL